MPAVKVANNSCKKSVFITKKQITCEEIKLDTKKGINIAETKSSVVWMMGGPFIGHISNITRVVVSVVLDMLHTTIRQEDTGSFRCQF